MLSLLILSLLCGASISHKIEGRISVGGESALATTRILVDDGQYRGYIRNDGTFVVHNVPSGSYVVDIVSPTYVFEPIRVDISSRGSIRARKLNNLKPSAVSLVKYPIDAKPLGMTRYFQIREKFSIFDLLKSPMVLMMVLPMLVLFILPKMINTSDPEVRKEMEQSMKMFQPGQNQMPDMAELVSGFFKSDTQKKQIKSAKAAKTKKQR